MSSDKRILIADDDYVASMLLEFNLKKYGFTVLSARDGSAAWQILQREQVDLVISDEQMPGISGLELCRLVRGNSRTASIPLILITCKAWEFNAEELKQTLGVAAVVEKPFSPRNLFTLLEEILFPESCGEGLPPVYVDLPEGAPVGL